MPDLEKSNPYNDPNLRSAWESGWEAFWEGKPPPDEHLFDDPQEMSAWLEGYLAAQDQEEE